MPNKVPTATHFHNTQSSMSLTTMQILSVRPKNQIVKRFITKENKGNLKTENMRVEVDSFHI